VCEQVGPVLFKNTSDEQKAADENGVVEAAINATN